MVMRLAIVVLAVFGASWFIPDMKTQEAKPKIPSALVEEHEGLHERLVALTRDEGEVGKAARKVAKALHPHFVREEEIALPPLGVLADAAAGKSTPEMAEAIRMSEQLRKELPGMLKEHEAIRAAVKELAETAKAAGNKEAEHFAEALAAHALMEEQVLYPAAILVGDYLKRVQKKD